MYGDIAIRNRWFGPRPPSKESRPAYLNIGPYTIPLDSLIRDPRARVSVDRIKQAVCDRFWQPIASMTSQRRSRDEARPRQVAMYLTRELTPRSLPQIGRMFGKRDHTTVMHAIRKVEQLRRDDHNFDADVRALLRELQQ